MKNLGASTENVQKAFDDEVKQYNQFMIAEAIGRKRIQAIKSSKEDALNSYILNMIDDSIHNAIEDLVKKAIFVKVPTPNSLS